MAESGESERAKDASVNSSSHRSFSISRRALLAATGASAILGLPRLTSPAWAQSSDALQDWLRTFSTSVRTVDAFDEDFSDLEPIAHHIADARVVQLGEPSHGAGTSFAAKVRLIKFLHQRMGFDVVAWESGFCDLEHVEAGLRAGGDPVAAAQRGILKIWSASEECRPLFQFAAASHATPRPLVMAGFDMQFTGPGGFDQFPTDLRSFLRALKETSLREEAMQAGNAALEALDALTAYTKARGALATQLTRSGRAGSARADALAAWERETGATLRPRSDAPERLRRAIDRLTELFTKHPAAFAEIAGERRRDFMLRALANVHAFGLTLYERYGVDAPARPDLELVHSNRRDALMAENLRWLIEEGYPDRKMIVWAHNAHVMNAYYLAPDFETISLDPAANAMKPMGVFLAEWLGDKLYTIGCTAFEGQDGWVGNPPAAIPRAPEGSIESRLHRLGLDYAFLDLRGARGLADHPLAGPRTMRVPKYDIVEIADVTRPYDAIFYVDQMKSATLLRSPKPLPADVD